MMLFIQPVLLVLLGICLLLVGVLLLQVVMAVLTKLAPRGKFKAEDETVTIAVLIPAHNEALGIASTLRSILPQLRKQDRVVVVADNCQDNTAEIARNLRVEAIERQDLSRRGKGYALDFGLKHLQANPPEVLIIVDADCIVAPDALSKLASASVKYQRPIQALYLMKNQPNPSIKARISEFAWVVRNHVRPLGMHVLGMPCQLMGTGMAFLWQDIQRINLATGHIVEDMKLGLDFAYQLKPPLFLPEALVTSYFPTESKASETQRTRWEHGHLSVILAELPKLMARAVSSRNAHMLAMGLDLMVPPLALLALSCLLVSAISFAMYALQLHAWMLVLPLCLMGMLIISVGLAWWGFARHIISLKQLCYVPVYMFLKIPLYLRFLVRRQVEWVRSKRD